MTTTNVTQTENGGYSATIDGVSMSFPPGGDLRIIQAWIDAGGVPTPYVAPTAEQILASLRAAARARFHADDEAALRAIVLTSLAYANETRAALNTLLAWLGKQATLTQRGQLAAMGLTIATPAQAKAAVEAKMDGGEAD